MSVDLINVNIKLEDIGFIIYILRTFFISICTYVTFLKIINESKKISIKNIILFLICTIIACLITGGIKYSIGAFFSTICLILLLSSIFVKTNKKNIGYTILITTISLSFNYILFVTSVIIVFIPNVLLGIENDFLNLILMVIIHSKFLYNILKVNKLKYGISFLRNDSNNEYFDILVLNISICILMAIIVFSNKEAFLSKNIFLGFIVFTIIMFITIQKSLQLYYKQKLLVQELNATKDELEKKTKEVEELEKENLSFSKKSHTLVHKQKSLEYKLQEIISKAEISKEEVGEVKDRLKEIEKDLYKEKTAIELDKTGISQIDDMLKYMQSECIKNKIDFELQLKGNIHYMINNLISKEDLETLLADHIKNAIIAINHTENINRTILVKLGKIDENYGLYIYDSGAEFEEETLQNLGKKPSTTHADEGGTGMGFMNTFDTLRKCNASLIIEEYNEPSKDNYTKAIIIKFDKNNEFKIKSYRESEILIK